MFVLQLNDMRSPKVEILTPVARAETADELMRFMDSEKVDGYFDDGWGKVFRKGGPLEWFNPPMSIHDNNIVDVGTIDTWAENARAAFNERVNSLPDVVNLLTVNP